MKELKKRGAVAIVVQRCHESVVGGAESLAWQYAQYLSAPGPAAALDVEIVTTRAADARSWANVLPAGITERESIRLRRFPVRRERGRYWNQLHELLVHHHRSRRAIPWTPALTDEWLRAQGPDSPAMLEYIRQNRSAFDRWIFVTYLFAPTVFGAGIVGRERAVLVPALHDEPPAYLRRFRRLARGVGRILWNTHAEAALAERLWGAGLPGQLVSMGVALQGGVDSAAQATQTVSAPPPEPARTGGRTPKSFYILYCGRIDPGKGCDVLFRYYRLFQKQHPGPLKLLLTGNLQMKLPSPAPGIKHLGFVSNAQKERLMAKAHAVVVPSPNESLSLITLEAMLLGTPVLALGSNPVLREHIDRSGGGLCFTGYESFRVALGRILGSPGLRESLGAAGQQYVRREFDPAVVRQRLLNALDVDGSGSHSTGGQAL